MIDSKSPELTVRVLSKAPARTPMRLSECVIAYTKDLDQPLRALSSFKNRWNAETKAQYATKIRDAQRERRAKTVENKCSNSIRVNVNSGAASHFLFIHSDASTFALHGDLRATFEDAVKGEAPLRLDVRRLSDGDQERALQAFAALTQTASWGPATYGKRNLKPARRTTLDLEVLSTLPKALVLEFCELGRVLGKTNNLVRTLADLPANELTPLVYRKKIQEYAKEKKLGFEFWDINALAKKKAGAFLAVARADQHSAGGIVRVTYTPKKFAAKKSGAPKRVVLVGKGICFDTGGYNIKTGSSMLGMHGDMTGSAIAIALCGMFAKLEVDFEVHAYLGLAENLISPTAYKPNEVVIASDGTSIEVLDTDAEGRMILADTLALARKEKPHLMIDFATLTGAAIRSLDTRRGAVFSNRAELATLAVTAGDASGERVWNFPIGEDYRTELKSKIADISQVSHGNNADHIYAATFLSHFAGDETPWIHMDLAPAENKGGLGLVSSDTTGFGVFWAEALIRRYFTEGT